MKQILALVPLAALGFAVAGCGSTKKAVSATSTGGLSARQQVPGTITVAGESTILVNVQPGTRVACKGWPGMYVTVPATGASVIARSHGTKELRLRHVSGGMLRVSCKSTR